VYYGECENMLAVRINWGFCVFTEWRRAGLKLYVDMEKNRILGYLQFSKINMRIHNPN